MQWLIVLLLLGVSFTVWMTVGGIRLVEQQAGRKRNGRNGRDTTDGAARLSPADVAVLVPAHNEELTIGATLDSARRLVPAGNIHVIADGCSDDTANLARLRGVNVLPLDPARGKATGIKTAVQSFDICRRFAVVLILDADTQLDEHYVERGLALLDDPEVGAVAGYAHTTWRPGQLSIIGRFLVSYRTRLYAVMQWIKYGQTWRHTNVTPIVPGFASMYRTRVVQQMDLNPPGLVIEDFNMTFELHHKRLGKVAFEPSVFGRTQDPDNLGDYFRQVKRWWLGFWQTLRRHGLWFSLFSAALSVFLVEIMIASVVLTIVAVAVLVLAAGPVSGGLLLQLDWYTAVYDLASPVLTPTNLLLFAFVPDYVLTCVVALWMRRPSMLVYGVGFLFIRLIDSAAALWTLQQTWRARSTGRWSSPRRRTVPVTAPIPAGPGDVAGSRSPESGAALAVDAAHGRHRPVWTNPVLRDMLLVTVVFAGTAWIVMVAVPLTVILALGIVALVIGAVRSHLRQAGGRDDKAGSFRA